MKMRVFIKPWCGWCHEALDWLKDHGFEFETLDVTSNREAAEEMKRLSGQTKAPTMDLDGDILPDFDTRQLEAFLKRKGIKF